MRAALVTSEPGDVRRGSGTALAVANLVDALGLNGVALAVVRGRGGHLGHTVARARLNRDPRAVVAAYDVVLGVGGDGRHAAECGRMPFVALPKALYGELLVHEHAAARAVLGVHAAWEANATRAATLVIAPSRWAAGVVHRRLRVPWSRIAVVGEPFPVARWRATLAVRHREGRRALLVAHLYARKRAVDAVAAWPAVRRALPGAELEIAGDGPQLGALRRAAAGVPGVRVHGHVDRAALRELYACADVAISTSAHETFGYAVLEALASGLPVVAASAPAVLELCEGAVATEVGVGDVAALSAAIVASLDPRVAAHAATINPACAARHESARVGEAYLAALAPLFG